ncbi:MAG: PASTA domain-containing protein, partial [Oscillospiraceae bacterium]|nr:PASTA domain-containing protein [Oscillospiraceae bacterium]
PSLYGMSVSEARATLAEYGLFLDTSGASPTDSSVTVSTQSANSGSEIPYGSVIEVTLVSNSSLGRY